MRLPRKLLDCGDNAATTFFQRIISEMRGPTGVKFCKMVSTKLCFIMPLQNFEGPFPKKFQGPKTCKIWKDFGRH